MRAAAILGLGTSPADLEPFQIGSSTVWIEGLPATAADADAVVIFGGDGTIHRHLGALVRLGLPVLVVPSGSGNDFARALRLRSAGDSLKAWRAFTSGRLQSRAIDLGVVRHQSSPEVARYFCCVAGCGLDSITARRANRMPRWLRGHGGYALALLPALLKLPAYPMKLARWNGVEENREEKSRLTLLAAFANTQFYGDGMRIAPQADPSDGQLDICRIWSMNPIELFCMFPTVYFGQHLLSPKVEYSKAERVRVETETPLEIYADGEFVCETPAEISVVPGALPVIGASTA
jgi:diacylglycerol kinase (ATP)